MLILHRPINHQDDRGLIVDIFPREGPDCVTLITNTVGAVRGNHVHDRSTQYVFVVSGALWTYHRRAGMPVQVDLLDQRDLAFHDEGEEHAYLAIEDTTFLALAGGVRKGTAYEDDTRRVPSLHDAWIAQGKDACSVAIIDALQRAKDRRTVNEGTWIARVRTFAQLLDEWIP